MIDKDTLRDAMLKECDILKHLFTKVPDGALDFRPSEGQRSMLELLRYCSFCGAGGTAAMTAGNWDRYGELAEASHELAVEDFPAAVDRQKEEIAAILDGLSDEDYRGKIVATPLGEQVIWNALFTMPLRWLGGYRMQLFLYCKQAGNTEISTPNCWEGIDWTPPAQ